MKLRKIHRNHIKAILDKHRAAGLSRNTVRLIRALMSVMMSDAIEEGILTSNPAAAPRRKGKRKTVGTVTQSERQRSIRPLTFAQLALFFKTAAKFGTRQEAMLFLTLADTGIRPGEALALRWEDIDTVGRTLRIEQAVSEGTIKSTKTDTPRTVDLTKRLAEALASWQAFLEAEALTGTAPVSEYVFTSAGRLLRAPDVARQFQALLRRAGLPKFRLYDLRHTFATQLLKSGAPITYVANQLGHAKPHTTLLFYSHHLPDGDKTHIDRLEAIRIKGGGDSRVTGPVEQEQQEQLGA